MIEGMAQLAGLLLEESLRERYGDTAKALMSVLERTRFREPVRPGDTLVYRAEVTSINRSGGKTSARATCNGRVVATTGMMFVFKHVDDPMLESRRAELMELWRTRA
jgi:3-hydroxyacyl-[acyl-carrier-protein] dehydratase